MRINAESVRTSFVACELLHKYKVLIFPRSIRSFIISMDDADLAFSEENLNEIK